MKEQRESSDSAHTAHTAHTRVHDRYQPYVVMKPTEAKQQEYNILQREKKCERDARQRLWVIQILP